MNGHPDRNELQGAPRRVRSTRHFGFAFVGAVLAVGYTWGPTPALWAFAAGAAFAGLVAKGGEIQDEKKGKR